MEKLKSSPVFAENSSSVNSILLLFFISYFIVGADLSKEIARERGEFKFFASILTQSNTVDTFSYLDFLITDPPVIGEIQLINIISSVSNVEELYRGRAPPILPLYI